MNEMNEYEKQELLEIGKWKSEEPGVASKVVGTLVKPLVLATEKVIPQAAIEGALMASGTAAEWMTDTSDVKRDGQVEAIAELRTKNLQLSDELSDGVRNWAIGLAAAEGLLTGTVGLPGLIADIPVLVTLCLRTINKIGLCYGYEPDTEENRRFVLGVLASVGANSVEEKAAAIAFLRRLQVMLVQKAWKMLTDEAVAKKLSEAAFTMGIEQLAKQLGINITKRAALKVIPLIGLVVGGAVNAAFVRDVGWAARRAFQERWLMENKKIPMED